LEEQLALLLKAAEEEFLLRKEPPMSNAEKTKTSLEGAWKLKSLHSKFNDGTEYNLPGNVIGSQIKMFSKNHVLFVGQLASEEKTLNNYGGGAYTLKGDDYIETLQYDAMKELVGKTHRFKLTIEGKTLTQMGPVDPEEQKRLGTTLTEVYEKMD
jgi:hypothetical protein